MEFRGRGAERLKSDDLLAFILFDMHGEKINEGMAKALNISRTGIALEYKQPMEKGSKIELIIGMGDEVVKVNGLIQNVSVIDNDNYHIGIEFEFLTEEVLNQIGMIYPNLLK